ncbi:hypothetical protein [Micromonospora chersina]
MPNQPTPSTSISPAAAFMLAVSVLAGTTLAGLVIAQAITPIHVYLGSGPLLGAIATLFGGGFLANIAVAKVMRRMDQIEALIEERGGFVDEEAAAAARRLNMRLLSGRN